MEAWQTRAALAQPSPVRSSLLINGYQLRAALDFIAPDGTAEQLESEACIEWRQQDADFLEAGLYAFCAEYPEEGGVLLDEEPSTAQPSPLQSEQAEAERPEVVGYLGRRIGMSEPGFHRSAEDAGYPGPGRKALIDLEQHDRIVGALRADRDSWAEQAEQRLADWDEMRKERDAALAKLTELEKQAPVKLPARARHSSDEEYMQLHEAAVAAWNSCLDEVGKLGPLYAAPVAPTLPEDVRVLLSRAQAEIEHLAECLENVCEDDEELDVAEDIEESIAVADKIANLIATAPVSKTAAPVQAESSLPDVCDGKEQDAFEEWATNQGMNMQCHPMHWLFLDAKTNSARQGWKAALKYIRAQIAAAPGKEVPQAWLDVQAERRRQVEVEGYHGFRDNHYISYELSKAARAYIEVSWHALSGGLPCKKPESWPWMAGFKWSDGRTMLVKACALALAEIERLDRAAHGKEVGHE
ncbi:hypothetical protein I5K32_15650 [Pseudomonas aeruginosa]|nr:hypothetical protein [Pseudomonas aeruginosa]